MNIVEFVVTLVSSGAVSLFLGWLLRTWIGERLRGSIKHEYEVEFAKLRNSQDTELEKHKARLQAENATTVERLKSDLQIAAMERHIRFSKLHEKVAECVVELWLRLKKLMNAANVYVGGLDTSDARLREERRVALSQAWKIFRGYHYENSIYVSRNTGKRIEELCDGIEKLAHVYTCLSEKEGGEYTPGRDTEKEVWRDLEEKVIPLFAELEDEFRRLLGVDPPRSS